jgi:hypothetical protein
MKLNLYIIFFWLFFFIFSYFWINKLDDVILDWTQPDSNLVYVKYFTNSNCIECTNIDDYLKVYKKAWVKFWEISVKEYWSTEYKTHFNEYNIRKLPFIVFWEELDNYQTISDSWNNTFWYKNNLWEYITTDIIPPYFDLESKQVKWLIDITYIWNNNCIQCYSLDSVINILLSFWLKFNNIKKINNSSIEAKQVIDKYKIKTLPTIILSQNTKLYKNFSYFWKTIWTIESDWRYILREPEKLWLSSKK